jgi:hypothetical protein
MESKTCRNCGASFDGAVCAYCGTRYVIESGVSSVPIRDVKVDISELYAGPISRTTSVTQWRLCTMSIMEGVARLTRALYSDGKQAREFKYHLVIPPELYPAALTIFESEKVPELSTNAKNVIGQLIDTIWIDPRLEGTGGPNLPWLLFSDDTILKTGNLYPDSGIEWPALHYSFGTQP